MLETFRRSFRERPRTALLFVAAAALTLFFALRLLLAALLWGPPGPRPIEPWMTMRMIGHMYHLDPREIDREAGLPPPQGHPPRTLGDRARENGRPVDEVIGDVEAAIRRLKEEER